MFILKSKIQRELKQAREAGVLATEKEWRAKLDQTIREQKELYEILISEKALEIDSLNSLVDRQREQMAASFEQEANAKRIFLKAKEIISMVDYEYKRQLENQARSMGQMDKIRHDAEKFSKQLLTQ